MTKTKINIEDWEKLETSIREICNHAVCNCMEFPGCCGCACNLAELRERFEVDKSER